MRLKAGFVVVVLIVLSFAGVSQRANGQAGTTPTPTEVLPPPPTDVPLPTETLTLTPSATPTLTETPTYTATATATATTTPSETATLTETPSATSDPNACNTQHPDANTYSIEAGRSDCLRDVLEIVNPNSAPQCAAVTIYLAPNSTYTFSTPDNPRNALPMITCPITIYGQGSVLQRDFATSEYFRFFEIKPNGALTLDNLTLQNGALPSANHAHIGGAIFVQHGRLTLQNGVRLVGNTAYEGGAIYNAAGTVAITHTLFNGNSANQDSAIYADAQATLRVNNSCFLYNTTHQLSYTVGTGGSIDATNNWWDAINGPATVATLTEQAVSAGVSYLPFVTTSPACDGEPNATATPEITATATFNPTDTATVTLTDTPSATVTNTNTATDTATPTFSATPATPTETQTPTSTPTLSATPVPPTPTPTPLPATFTPTTSPSLTPTQPKATVDSPVEVPPDPNCDFGPNTPYEYQIGAGQVDCLVLAVAMANPTTCPEYTPVIQLAQNSTYTFVDGSGLDETGIENALPQIRCALTVDGRGALLRRDDALNTPLFRFFWVTTGGNLTLDHLSLSNGKISASQAAYVGGAIRVKYGSLTLQNQTRLDGNYAYNGGALAASYATVTIHASRFEDNYARTTGGAIYILQTQLTLTHSQFVSNGDDADGIVRTGNGGALDIQGESVIHISHTQFEGNRVGLVSAIHADMNYTPGVSHSTLVIEHSIFTGNYARNYGNSRGVVYVQDTRLIMTDSVFSANEDAHVAGLYLGRRTAATLDGVDFIGNNTIAATASKLYYI